VAQEHILVTVSDQQISTELDGDYIILNLNSGMYYELNAVSARIWSLIQAPKTVAEIESAILAEYEVTLEECKRDIDALLQDLQEKGLIELRTGVGE
jgi:hypothetical protein